MPLPPNTGYATDSLCHFLISALRVAAKTESISSVVSRTQLHRLSSKFSTKSFTKGESGRSMPRSTTSIPLAGREDRRIPANDPAGAHPNVNARNVNFGRIEGTKEVRNANKFRRPPVHFKGDGSQISTSPPPLKGPLCPNV